MTPLLYGCAPVMIPPANGGACVAGSICASAKTKYVAMSI